MSTDDPWAPWSTTEHADTPAGPARSRRPGPLVIVAVVLFSVGVLFSVAAALAPFLLGRDAPTWLYLAAMLLTPAGFLLALVALVVSGSRRRTQRP